MTLRNEPAQRHQDRIEYRFYFALLMPLSMLLALAAFVLPGRKSVYARKERRPSLFGQAVQMNRTAVPWVFMGR